MRGLRTFMSVGMVALAVGAAAPSVAGGRAASASDPHVSNASTSVVFDTTRLAEQHRYRVTATGTASDWCPSTATQASDCSYGSPLQVGAGVDALYCYATWRCQTPTLWRPLQARVGDSGTWGGIDQLVPSAPAVPYTDTNNHSYSVVFTASRAMAASTLEFMPADGSPEDNSGGWDVTVTDLGLGLHGKAHKTLALGESHSTFVPHAATLASGAVVTICNHDAYLTGMIFTHDPYTSMPKVHNGKKTPEFAIPSIHPGKCRQIKVFNHTARAVTVRLFSDLHASQKAVLTVEPA